MSAGSIENGGDVYYAETQPGQGIASLGLADSAHAGGTDEPRERPMQ